MQVGPDLATCTEASIDYVGNVLELWIRLWNLNPTIENTMFYSKHMWDIKESSNKMDVE